MLASLHIENVAVIKNLDIDFPSGFSVLTGETGAGKSKIIDSVGMAVGAKATKDIVRNGESTALVSALFTDLSQLTLEKLSQLDIAADSEGNLFIQRSITAEGKSISKVNGRTIPLSLHKQIGRILINIHGQHENNELLEPSKHIDILDRYANCSLLIDEYEKLYGDLKECISKREALVMDERLKEQKIDMLEYQIADIESAALKSGEDEELENELNILKNIKQLSKSITTVYRALYKNEKGMSASKLIEIARSSLENVADTVPSGEEYLSRLYDLQYELEEIAKNCSQVLQGTSQNPEMRITQIEDRLDIIKKLRRKYGSSVDEILEFCENAKAELSGIKGSEKLISELLKKEDRLYENALEVARRISQSRKKSALELSEKICGELTYLDMAKVKFKVSFESPCDENGKIRLSSKGIDSVEFLINTNPGEPFRPLSKIASGGELSRIMLAIKCVLSGASGIETVVFDEIDTGVSGKTAQKIGIKLSELAKTVQVFSITHSAQVASGADCHFKIYKEVLDGRAYTKVVNLDSEGRISELARIMGGVNITDSVLKSAKELLEYRTTDNN